MDLKGQAINDTRENLEKAIWEVLWIVFDPELGFNVVDLNRSRSVWVDGKKVQIERVLTIPG